MLQVIGLPSLLQQLLLLLTINQYYYYVFMYSTGTNDKRSFLRQSAQITSNKHHRRYF